MSSLKPPQQRVARDLFLTGRPRPAADLHCAQRLRRLLEDGTATAASLVPAGERLVLGKSALDALSCDGRFVDRLDGPFTWNTSMLRGQLAHSAVAVDHWGARTRSPAQVVDHAWAEFASRGTAAGTFLATLGGAEADALRGQVTTLLLEFRDLFPQLPPSSPVRAEPTFEVVLHDRRIALRGQPDLVLGDADRARRRMLLLDLKSGGGNAQRDRAEMRFYALLATLKYGVAPFRVATFYLDAGTWGVEDVDDAMLTAAAEVVVDKAERAARLTYQRPPEADLRLVPGPACRWCLRARQCPESPTADASRSAAPFYSAAGRSSYS